ncbi:protein phosphatase 1 regulatory subunit 3G [Diretmus argenteus]
MSDPPRQLYAGEAPTPWQGDGEVPTENGQEEEEDEDLEDELDSSHLERFMKDRRRARSLPAYPGQAALFQEISEENNGRKRVKFADSLGLNLASVKHFSTLEEPQIPTKVLSRLRSFPPQPQDALGDLCANFQSSLTMDRLVACFPEPGEADDDVDERVKLEKVTITHFEVRGQIRVFAGCSVKEVGVRYTFNNWLSHVDAQALPAAAGHQPRYSFTMYTPPFLDPSSSVHLAVYLKSDEGEFWDNNGGQNYSFRYRSMPGTTRFQSAAFT